MVWLLFFVAAHIPCVGRGAHLDEEAISGRIGGAQNDIIPGAVGEVRLEVGSLGFLPAPALHPREATHPRSTATLTPPPALSFRPLLNPPSKNDCPSRQRCVRRGESAPYVGPSAGSRCSQRPPSGHCPDQMSEAPCTFAFSLVLVHCQSVIEGLFQLPNCKIVPPFFTRPPPTRGRLSKALKRHAGRRHGGARRDRGVEEGCFAISREPAA